MGGAGEVWRVGEGGGGWAGVAPGGGGGECVGGCGVSDLEGDGEAEAGDALSC